MSYSQCWGEDAKTMADFLLEGDDHVYMLDPDVVGMRVDHKALEPHPDDVGRQFVDSFWYNPQTGTVLVNVRTQHTSQHCSYCGLVDYPSKFTVRPAGGDDE